MTLSSPSLDAAAAIKRADALLICAGAGMGVDSGLPDFRGNAGFWRAYPPFATRGLSFAEVAKPQWFRDDPALAWGFYGHRMHLYRDTQPHEGFALLKSWADTKARPTFVFTSNVDGHFQRAGFADEQVCEVHGSIDHLQCSVPCCDDIWSAEAVQVVVSDEFLAQEPFPKCPRCGAVARPNILMFDDGQWAAHRTWDHKARLKRWQERNRSFKITVVECGAGTAIPTVRRLSEAMQRVGAKLVRINPREPEGPSGTIGLTNGARDALHAIAERLL